MELFVLLSCLGFWSDLRKKRGAVMSKHANFLDAPHCTQFGLPIPPGLGDQLSEEQAAKVAKIQLHFSRSVALLMAKSLAEVAALMDATEEKPAVGF